MVEGLTSPMLRSFGTCQHAEDGTSRHSLLVLSATLFPLSSRITPLYSTPYNNSEACNTIALYALSSQSVAMINVAYGIVYD